MPFAVILSAAKDLQLGRRDHLEMLRCAQHDKPPDLITERNCVTDGVSQCFVAALRVFAKLCNETWGP